MKQKIPTEQITKTFNPISGSGSRTVKTYSYVLTLCEKGGSEVKAVRANWYANKYDAIKEIRANYPEWNIKNVLKLYEDDFREASL